MTIGQHVILGVVIGVTIWIVGWWALRRTRAAIFRAAMLNMPRAQSLAFQHRLRTLAFGNPFGLMETLWSERRDGYVRDPAGKRESLE